MSSADRDTFTSSFSICICFISFSCQISLIRTSSSVLNTSDKSGHPCLVSDLGGKTFSFSLLHLLLIVSFSYMAFIMLRWIPSICSLLRFFFLSWKMLNVVKCFFCINWDYHVGFFLYPINVIYYQLLIINYYQLSIYYQLILLCWAILAFQE